MPSTRDIGRASEALALSWLTKQGYRLLAQNWRHKRYELDLVLESPNADIVFLEVKARQNSRYGRPAEHLTEAQQRRLAIAAQAYLTEYALHDRNARFDVLTVDYTDPSLPEVQHFPDAFFAPQSLDGREP